MVGVFEMGAEQDQGAQGESSGFYARQYRRVFSRKSRRRDSLVGGALGVIEDSGAENEAGGESFGFVEASLIKLTDVR